MTLAQILARQRASLTAVLAEREAASTLLRSARERLPETGDVPDDLAREITSGVETVRAADTRIETLRSEISATEDEIRREESVAELSRQLQPTGVRTPYDQAARVVSEQRTYGPHNRAEGVSFLRDVAALGNLDAMQRLQRHQAEELVERGNMLQRDIGTSALSGVTIPQYLIDMVAPKAAAGRPFIDNCRKRDLPPDGMTVEISRVTTATSAAIQATQNATVSETDIDDTQLTVNVRTIAGQQDVARQAVDRSVGSEDIVVGDLVKRYHTALNASCLNDDGTSGTHLGIRSTTSIQTVTYTDSTPTPSEAWGPLWDLQQKAESAVFMAMTHFVMTPRRWAFFCSAIGTNQAMLGQMGVAPLLLGQEQSKAYGPGVRGILAGLPVIVDAGIPTNISSTQDVILGINADEIFIWEDPGAPLRIRAEQTGAGSLTVKFVVYGYSAFTAGRYPEAHGVISGSGLTTPTFGIAAS